MGENAVTINMIKMNSCCLWFWSTKLLNLLVFTFFSEYCIWTEVKKVVDQFFKQMTLNLIKKLILSCSTVICTLKVS